MQAKPDRACRTDKDAPRQRLRRLSEERETHGRGFWRGDVRDVQAAGSYPGRGGKTLGERANVVYVDVNSYYAVATKYHVSVIPTQIFFDAKGKEVSRHVGLHPLKNIESDLVKAGMK